MVTNNMQYNAIIWFNNQYNKIITDNIHKCKATDTNGGLKKSETQLEPKALGVVVV
jgi:hypothetical protein